MSRTSRTFSARVRRLIKSIACSSTVMQATLKSRETMNCLQPSYRAKNAVSKSARRGRRAAAVRRRPLGRPRPAQGPHPPGAPRHAGRRHEGDAQGSPRRPGTATNRPPRRRRVRRSLFWRDVHVRQRLADLRAATSLPATGLPLGEFGEAAPTVRNCSCRGVTECFCGRQPASRPHLIDRSSRAKRFWKCREPFYPPRSLHGGLGAARPTRRLTAGHHHGATACTKTVIPARNVTVVANVGINFLHAAKF